MKILLAGGSGFIGTRLLASLRGDGHDVTVLTRSASKAEFFKARGVAALLWSDPGWTKVLETTDAVVNLAGEGVADGRWSAERKQRILTSRLDSTRSLVEAIGKAANRPKLLVNASAVGFYGPRGEEEIDEKAAAGKSFLSGVCVAWENEALKARASGARVVLLRIGVVLGRDGGALPRMLLPFRLRLGGRLGSGAQWFPWIHVEDVVGLAKEALTNLALSGPVNVTAPGSATNAGFTKALGGVLSRPTFAPAPAFAVRLLLGEMSEMMLTGQRAVPAAAVKAAYRFKFPGIRECLADLLEK